MISLPSNLSARIYHAKELMRISGARLRAHWYQLLGAHLEPKCLLGKRTRLEHPWCITLGKRCMLQENVWLNVGDTNAVLEIGEYTFIGRNTEIEVARSVRIGKGCLIAPGVFITDHNHALSTDEPMWQQSSEISKVIIGDDVWISAYAVILPGVTIGEGAVVAAGAVVSRDVEPCAVVGGVPAKVIKMREHFEDKAS